MTARQQGRQLNAAFSLRPRSVCAMRAIWMIVLRPCLFAQHSPASLCLSACASLCVCVCVLITVISSYLQFIVCTFGVATLIDVPPAAAIVIDCSDLAAVSRRSPSAAAVACERCPISRSEVWLSSAAAYAILKNIPSHSLQLHLFLSLFRLRSHSICCNIANWKHLQLNPNCFNTNTDSFSFFICLAPLSPSPSLCLTLSLCIASLTDNENNKEVFFCCLQTK